MRGTESKKLALRARGLGKNLATGMVSVGISVFAPRIAPLLGIGAILADNDGAPKRALFWGVRLIILRMGKTPPGFLLNVVDGGGDEHTSAREPLPLPVDAISVALRPFGNSSAVMLVCSAATANNRPPSSSSSSSPTPPTAGANRRLTIVSSIIIVSRRACLALPSGARMVMPVFAPYQWRSITFYRRLIPILWRCYVTKRASNRCVARGNHPRANALWRDRHEVESKRVIELILDMKGFYLKLGQVLASKGDILPQPYLLEMARLFGDLPPVSFEHIRDVVAFELDVYDLYDVFETFDEEPVAVGTIAQIHRATLRPSERLSKDHEETRGGSRFDGSIGDGGGGGGGGGGGRRVAVKVPKPGVKKQLLADIKAMRRAAELCDSLGLELGFDSASILREYETQVPLEFDFNREAAVMDRAARSLERGAPSSIAAEVARRRSDGAGEGGGYEEAGGGTLFLLGACSIPKPLLEYCTPGLIVMDWAPGTIMTEAAGLRSDDGATSSSSPPPPPPEHCRRMVTALLQALAQQIFVDRCFNSDPHPGNIVVDTDEGKVRLLDFGQSKEITEEECERVAWLIMALSGRDDQTVASAMTQAGVVITDITAARRGGGGGGGGGSSRSRGSRGSRASRSRGSRGSRSRGSKEEEEKEGNARSASVANAAACAYILFDTRMDIPHARAGPELLELQRTTAVSHFPEELFMLMRVVTIVRGLLGVMHVDVSAAKVWEPWARHTLGLLPCSSDEDIEEWGILFPSEGATGAAAATGLIPPPRRSSTISRVSFSSKQISFSSTPRISENMAKDFYPSGGTNDDLSLDLYSAIHAAEKEIGPSKTLVTNVSLGRKTHNKKFNMPMRLGEEAVLDTGFRFL